MAASEQRVDSLLAELGARHGNSGTFLAALRPALIRILDPGTPESVRPDLLEQVAVTCERAVAIQRDGEAARQAVLDYAAQLQALLRRLLGDAGGPDEATP